MILSKLLFPDCADLDCGVQVEVHGDVRSLTCNFSEVLESYMAMLTDYASNMNPKVEGKMECSGTK